MHKNHELKEKAGKAAKKVKTEVKKIPGTKENPTPVCSWLLERDETESEN